MIILENWGLTPYREAWQRQRSLWLGLQADMESPEYIISVEHPPVYTLGFHGNESNLLVNERTLTARGAECIRVERGGDITYHGPGQLVVYPIISLRRHGLGVKKYIDALEDAVILTLAEFGINAIASPDEIGVWIDRGTPMARKICAIGVKISHGVTMHGLALNVNTDLSDFGLINPCGILDKGVTSMQRELHTQVDMDQVRKSLLKNILLKLKRQ